MMAMAAALAFNVGAETFRVHKTNMLVLEDSFEKKTTDCGINDAVAVVLPKDMTFIQGIEISIRVPKEVAAWQDSVVWSLYSSVEPRPEDSVIDYSGTRENFGTFESLSMNIRVPVKKENNVTKDAYSTLAELIPAGPGESVFLRLQLAMKGVDDSIWNSHFQISAKPLLIDEGILSMELETPEGELINDFKDCTVFIDKKQTDMSSGSVMETIGQHTVSVISSRYRNELRTVTIEQAKETRLKILLRDIKPMVRLVAPENARVVFDETEYTAPVEPFNTTQGDHTIKFLIGDYEIVRSITVTDGRSYTVSVNIDAVVSEEE